MDINNYFLLFPVLLPIIAGVLLMFIKFGKREHMQLYIFAILVIDLASVGWIALQPEDTLTLSQFFMRRRTSARRSFWTRWPRRRSIRRAFR